MANSNNSNLAALISLIFFTSIPFHTSAIASPNDVVADSICPKTRNPPFCFTVVQSAATANLKTLAGYSLNLAHTNAAHSLRLAKSLAATAADSRLRQRYSSCSANFARAFADIDQAQRHLADGEYYDVTILISGVVAEIDRCLGSFKMPRADTSALTKKGNTVEDLCSIVLVLADLLPGVGTDGN